MDYTSYRPWYLDAPQESVEHAEARDYYALCARARALGISTSLDDPSTPESVIALRAAVDRAGARHFDAFATRVDQRAAELNLPAAEHLRFIDTALLVYRVAVRTAEAKAAI